jgi:hypothetical protein
MADEENDDNNLNAASDDEEDAGEEASDILEIRRRALAVLERCGPTEDEVLDYDDEEEDSSDRASSADNSLYDDEELDPLVTAVRELSISLETEGPRQMTHENHAYDDDAATNKCVIFLVLAGVLSMYHLWYFVSSKRPDHH